MSPTDEAYRKSLVEAHVRLAADLAHRTIRAFNLDDSLADEVMAAANLGLAEAASRYDPMRGTAFSTFAYYRIRGAIFDALRDTGVVKHGAARRLHVEQCVDEILESRSRPSRQGLEDAVADLAEDLAEVGMAEFLGMVSAVDGLPDSRRGAEDAVSVSEEVAALREAMEGLEEREKRLLEFVYFQDMTLKDAGLKLGMSRSWACRIHSKATAKLRRALMRRGVSP